MKLLIKDWSQKNLSKNAVGLMEEAIMCYKVGAYRSAYLMSYLAFKTTIRERILNAPKPDCINDTCWNDQILEPLDNDNKWEEAMNNIIFAAKESGQGPGAVFKFTNYERIKNRYEYWKNIRNSCAHAKDEHITSSTVEQFWNYMQDDLSEYYVLGGKQYLIEKLSYDYKYFYTVGKEELENTLKDITIIYRKDIVECFDSFCEKNPICLQLESKNIEFWKEIICGSNEIIREGFLDFFYMRNDAELFMDWYKQFPQFFYFMISRHKEMIQETIAPRLEEQRFYLEEDVFWHLLVEILKIDANLIDINKVTSDYYKFKMIKVMNLSEEELEVLHKYKVFQKFLLNAGKEFFKNDSESHFKYYNYISETEDTDIEQCFKYMEWDIHVIETFNNAISELENSCECRSNSYSIENGKTRKEIYKKIVYQYKNNIEETVQKSQREMKEYKFVSDLLYGK